MHWWAELWDNWAKTFGYDHWEWGSASDAFAAIGTVGALAVTLHIVRKDRRDKAQELARGITGWWEAEDFELPHGGPSLTTAVVTVTVHNSAAHPVTGLSAFYILRSQRGFELPVRGTLSERKTSLKPNSEVVFKGDAHGTKVDIENVLLTYYDNNGVHWTRNLATQEILPTRTSAFRRHLDYYWWMIGTGGGTWGSSQKVRSVRK